MLDLPVSASLSSAGRPADERTGDERFLGSARALFYSRLALLTLGLGVLFVPAWSHALGVGGRGPFLAWIAMVLWTAAALLLADDPRFGRPFTFATLCADLAALAWLATATGGLRSPLLAVELLYAAFFVVLFPSPFAVLPPLLTFPAVAKFEPLAAGRPAQLELFVLLWYAALNCILVYVLVSLGDRERSRQDQLRALGDNVREVAVLEERNRLAREIHDGLGGVLSSVVIQSEYLLNMIDGSEVRARLHGDTQARAAIIPTIRKELTDLHEAAQDSMDELRRSLRMMQDHFDLVAALEDHCRVAAGRFRLDVRFSREGRERAVGPGSALALFRVLQECLANVSRHCGAGTRVDVTLAFGEGRAKLSVRDHGKGFDVEAAARRAREGHYGLANMKERARKVSGAIRIQSAEGLGTTVELAVHAGEEPSSS